MNAARRWIREPLLHFVLLGLLLVGVRSALHPGEAPAPIVLTTALDQALADEHRLARGAPPTGEETEAARARWTREEALYREALALGLDEGDAIVRRRLIQKMTFVLEASIDLPDIEDDEAAAYLDAHPSAFEIPERRALDHRYFGERSLPSAEALAQAARAVLMAGGDAPGDAFLAADGFASVSEAELSRSLGQDAARAIFAAEPGEWSEPITVGRGALLIRVRDESPAHPPALATVRSRIDAALMEANREEALEAAVAEVLTRYEVVREP